MPIKNLPTKKDVVDFVVSAYGGKDELFANALDVGRFNVPKWRKIGIPPKHHHKIVSDIPEITHGMLHGSEALPDLVENTATG